MLTVQSYSCASRPDLEPLATIFRDALHRKIFIDRFCSTTGTCYFFVHPIELWRLTMEKFKRDNRSLREGIASLAAVQGAEYLIPLLALPYLLRVLGPVEFGKIAFVQAFC